MDVAIDGEVAGRLLFELYSDVCSKTSENFRALCTGERGMLPSGLMMDYLGWIQAGGNFDRLFLFYKMRMDLLYIIHLCFASVCFYTFCLLTVRKIVRLRAHSYVIALRKKLLSIYHSHRRCQGGGGGGSRLGPPPIKIPTMIKKIMTL